MPIAYRLACLSLPTALLVACGDNGGGSAGDSTTTSPTGVTTATVSDPTVTGTSATDTATTDDGTGGASVSSATQPTTTADPTSNSGSTDDPGTATTPGTETGTTDIDPFNTSSGGSDTTFDSFGDTGDTSGTGDPALCKMQIDIVFVMDVSTSMLGVLQKLEEEILTVDAKLKALDVLPDVNYGLVVFVDDTEIINGGAPYDDVQTLKSDFNYWWNFTQTNSQVSGNGSNGDWPENSIDAIFTASGAFQWRPLEQTLRMVIHCTDDTFGVKGAIQSNVAIQHTYEETVLSLQDRQVRVFAFADNDKTGGPGDNEDVSMGFFTPYNGQTPIPAATDGGAFNINLVNKNQLSLSAAINDSVEQSLCQQYIPQ